MRCFLFLTNQETTNVDEEFVNLRVVSSLFQTFTNEPPRINIAPGMALVRNFAENLCIILMDLV